MLQFVYVTDLHGWELGYEATLALALRLGIPLIVNGGDMLPKGKSLENSLSAVAVGLEIPPIFEVQSSFLNGYLREHFQRCQSNGIRYLAMFGNDDFQCHLDVWHAIVDQYENVDDLSTSWHHLADGVSIRGCNYVPDVPFRLKDWALRDTDAFVSPAQLGQPVISAVNGPQMIEDIDQYLNSRPTLEQMLRGIACEFERGDFRRAILVGHSPPADTGLAVIHDGTDVGSSATTSWIQRHQPLLTLHGHIHESPVVSGIHTTSIGQTVSHNPGQFAPERVALSVVTIDQEAARVERMLLDPALS